MSAAKAFFDTNVLLYMYGGTEAGKRMQATELFRQHARSGDLLLSTQVVQEFHAAGSRKLGMPRRELREATTALLDLPIVVIGAVQIKSAIHLEERFTISFWDALLLAAAESGGAGVLYTEELNDGQQYGTVLVRNPFRASESASSAVL